MPTKHQEESVSRKALWPLWRAGRFLLGMVFLSMLAVVVAVACLTMGVRFSLDGQKQVLSPAYMMEINRRSLEQSPNRTASETAANWVYAGYFKWTGIHSMAMGQSDQWLFGRVVNYNPETFSVAMLAARLFGIRAANVLFSFPLILLVLALALVDGLAEREIRRECGGRESGRRFRLAKKFSFALLPPVVAIFYLCLPFDYSLGMVMLPALAVMAILYRMKAKYLVKYF